MATPKPPTEVYSWNYLNEFGERRSDQPNPRGQDTRIVVLRFEVHTNREGPWIQVDDGGVAVVYAFPANLDTIFWGAPRNPSRGRAHLEYRNKQWRAYWFGFNEKTLAVRPLLSPRQFNRFLKDPPWEKKKRERQRESEDQKFWDDFESLTQRGQRTNVLSKDDYYQHAIEHHPDHGGDKNDFTKFERGQS